MGPVRVRGLWAGLRHEENTSLPHVHPFFFYFYKRKHAYGIHTLVDTIGRNHSVADVRYVHISQKEKRRRERCEA